MRTLKNPLDMWNYQEIIFERAHRMGAGNRHAPRRLGAVLRRAARGARRLPDSVISVDVDHDSLQIPRDGHQRLRLLKGDSASPAMVGAIRSLLPAPRAPLFLILDSDHRASHVLRELRAYVPLLQSGDYLVVEDSCVNGHPVRPDFGPGPMEAIDGYLAANPGVLAPDTEREEKFACTFAPRGYFRKK